MLQLCTASITSPDDCTVRTYIRIPCQSSWHNTMWGAGRTCDIILFSVQKVRWSIDASEGRCYSLRGKTTSGPVDQIGSYTNPTALRTDGTRLCIRMCGSPLRRQHWKTQAQTGASDEKLIASDDKAS